MTAFYLDEDVPIELADLLRARGYDAETTRDAARLGRSDPEQLLYAANGGMILVTYNRAHFARLHEAWTIWARDWGVARPHAGIVTLWRVFGKPPAEYADLIADLIAEPERALLDTFWSWRPGVGWTQKP